MSKRPVLTYEDRAHQWMRPWLADLQRFTKPCRIDMHEPNEQEISAHVVGTSLDNACGESIREDAITRGYQEIVVILRNGETGEHLKLNLACLIALARLASIPSTEPA